MFRHTVNLGSVFLANMDLENMITLVFFGIYFDSPFGKPQMQSLEGPVNFVAKRTFNLKGHCTVPVS